MEEKIYKLKVIVEASNKYTGQFFIEFKHAPSEVEALISAFKNLYKCGIFQSEVRRLEFIPQNHVTRHLLWLLDRSEYFFGSNYETSETNYNLNHKNTEIVKKWDLEDVTSSMDWTTQFPIEEGLYLFFGWKHRLEFDSKPVLRLCRVAKSFNGCLVYVVEGSAMYKEDKPIGKFRKIDNSNLPKISETDICHD